MNRNDLLKYFNGIMERTRGHNNSDKEIIDYENGNSISLDEIENEYYEYKDLEEEIDNYIDDEDLDSVSDEQKIKEHFKNIIDEDLFLYNQGYLKDFVDYISTKINKKNEHYKKINVIFSKNGNGFDTTKISLPLTWLKKINVSKEDREVVLELKDDQIIISKY